MIDRLQAGDLQGALEQHERRPLRGDALYQLEDGMLLRLAGRCRESNQAFDAADRIIEDLYTRSVSREAAALAISDRLAPYRPAPYERLLARVYHARNYLEMGDCGGALVEARRIEQLLGELEEGGGLPEAQSGATLATLTAALAFEAGNQLDDALRMYRRLEEDGTYERQDDTSAFPWVENRMQTLASETGFDLAWVPGGDQGQPRNSLGYTVVIFIDRGLVPQRKELRLDVPILKGEAEREPEAIAPLLRDRALECRDGRVSVEGLEVSYWLPIALPFYDASSPTPSVLTIEAGGIFLEAQPVSDIGELARAALDERMPELLIRSAVRGLVKYGAHRQARKQVGKLGGILANAVGVATERAETRSWSTLPQDVYLFVLDLAQPVEGIHLRWTTSDGGEVVEFLPLTFQEGEHFQFATGRIWQ